jgi:hypothetical protein
MIFLIIAPSAYAINGVLRFERPVMVWRTPSIEPVNGLSDEPNDSKPS